MDSCYSWSPFGHCVCLRETDSSGVCARAKVAKGAEDQRKWLYAIFNVGGNSTFTINGKVYKTGQKLLPGKKTNKEVYAQLMDFVSQAGILWTDYFKVNLPPPALLSLHPSLF